MNESTTKVTRHFTGFASLAAVGVKLKQLDLFGPIRKSVQIAQKTVKDTPIDKLYDAFISLLAGAHGLVEINSRLRADPALQMAFGREPRVLSSRWCKRPWMPAPPRMGNRWSKRWIPSIESRVKALGMTLGSDSRSWMWT